MIVEASKNGLWSIRLQGHWHQPPLLPTHHVTGSKNNPQKSDVKSYFKYIFKKYNNNNNIIIIELCDICNCDIKPVSLIIETLYLKITTSAFHKI